MTSDATSKRCFKCLTEKPLGAFYAHHKMSDGRLGKCKECTKSDVTANRLANVERIRAYDRLRASKLHRIENNVKQVLEWRQKYPNRMRAQSSVAYALLTGKLVRQPCWVCGVSALAHHPDYDRPLDVVWLCQPHHKQTHALVKAAS